MTMLTTRRSLLPKLASDLFDSGKFFGPRIWDFNSDFNLKDMDFDMPMVNIMETEKEYKLEMGVPGMDKKDFKIQVAEDMLTVSTEKSKDEMEEGKNFTRREFSYFGFSRSFKLPENCMSDKIDARYENGILMIILPKKELSFTKASKEIKVS